MNNHISMNRSVQMNVCVQVDLTAPDADKHLREMRSAALGMTDDERSVRVSVIRDYNLEWAS